MTQSGHPGRGNVHNERVFIAVGLYDKAGDLARGVWGQGLLDLIELLGANNTFLSIYENDSGPEAAAALDEFEQRVPCNKSIVFEDHFDASDIATATLPDGSVRTKRLPYLAAIRNRALDPLNDNPHIRYDKLLYLNDVFFDPMDAVQLLFSTNVGPAGTAQYRAACAVDFINPFKLYDTFAVRDLHGFTLGVPFYPWFTSVGAGESRRDVLDQKDAVRLRSCWGGMVAFDAQYFQVDEQTAHSNNNSSSSSSLTDVQPTKQPVRFRALADLYWEGSECCLIHADIQDNFTDVNTITDTGIYLNPYVRVAYDTNTLSWLALTRRFERLYTFPHWVANTVIGASRSKPRREETGARDADVRVWQVDDALPEGGAWVDVRQPGDNGAFCAGRGMQVLVQDRSKADSGWEVYPIPEDPVYDG
ncbi:hypothetical protein PISL3812_08281 [Talaromyces islandicus]|uniref:Alpha-1,3-mannosyltransferase CMT1 n=1 Tax=Talaromyces islandicus TaxID=28573 RepID=A0A0U1M6K7_TALIS|nr:hypothetical protein PISL3812_08281 [Talaromyces islandicus]